MVTFLELGRYGRFGNQLYQIAGVMGIAIKNGHPYSFPKWINYDAKEKFGTTEDINLFEHLLNPLSEVPSLNYDTRFVQWGYHDVRLGQGAFNIEGHLQSPEYFRHCIDLVRNHLTFKDEPPLNNYCAIHWRAGDYQEGDNVYHPRQTKEYYREAMSNVPQGTKFLIFSDDQDAAKRMFYGINAEYANGNYIEDYKLMKSCKHFIIANSTFSSFAATMANQDGKIVVAPKKWFGRVAGINGDDIYDKDWIVI